MSTPANNYIMIANFATAIFVTLYLYMFIFCITNLKKKYILLNRCLCYSKQDCSHILPNMMAISQHSVGESLVEPSTGKIPQKLCVTTSCDILPSSSPFEAGLFLYLLKSRNCEVHCLIFASLPLLFLERPDILNNW
jgi:hypothetical protein